ncbi:ommochrome-binding protein-like [Pieris napi]|uniref:ommochrome-binding protein-like n=1 Tax=Pieris napi TaxID=78633 RepID=UPI001FBB034D|nr:ommochrome-binding protein-like [Pieris napi]XP_047509667.1 ommochrome-binding protein-like [Pieris napi]
MKTLFIFLTLLGYSIAKRVSCHACLNTVCYRRDRIVQGIKFSGQLAIDRSSNILYFHYQNRSEDYTAAFDLYNVRLKTIKRGFSFGFAVDQTTKDLYMTNEQGLYRYNPEKNNSELFGLNDKTIWQLQYEKKLFYSEFRKKGIFTYENKKSKLIPGTEYEVDDFIVDKMGDIYFMHNFSIYVLKNGAKSAELFEDEIYYLTTDRSGDAYFIQPFTRAVYKMNYKYDKRILKELGAFSRGYAFIVVFDGDNDIIYYDGSDKKLYYLSQTANRCTVTAKRVGKNLNMVISMPPDGD